MAELSESPERKLDLISSANNANVSTIMSNVGGIASGQKRGANSDRVGPASKRAHVADAEDYDSVAEESVQVKVLIPTSAVGAIIGKGGETMRTLKNDSGCKVQMSKNQDIYPGTSERICLVKGKISSVMKVMDAIMEKIREKVDRNCPTDQFDHKGCERNKEMKLLVPNTSAGMVIGKSGARIKEIRDATGANIQVYPKQGSQEAKVSQERVITIAAESKDVLLNAVERVLEKIAADPLHAHNSELSVSKNQSDEFGSSSTVFHHQQSTGGFGDAYRGAVPPVPSYQQQPPFGPPPSQQAPNNIGYAGGPPQYPPPPTQQQPPLQQNQRPSDQSAYGSPGKDAYNNGSSAAFKFNPMQGLGNAELMAFLDSLQSTLRTSGFNEQGVGEVMQAMQVLAKYNIMGLGLGLGVAAMAQMRTTNVGIEQQQQPSQRYESHHVETPPDRNDYIRPSNESLGGVLIDVMSQGKQNQNFAASVIKERPQMDMGFLELEVPDAIVGAVLGQKAKTLQDIQHFSGAKVEVHKRNNANPGTRLITLSGDPEHVRAGRVMIEQVINDEQNRRLHQQQRAF